MHVQSLDVDLKTCKELGDLSRVWYTTHLRFLDAGVQYKPPNGYRWHSDKANAYIGSMWRCVIEEIKVKLE